MKGLRVGWLIGAALVLQGCAGAGGAGPARYTDTDKVILGVFSSEDLSCPTHMTKVCAGINRLSMECSCEHPQNLQMTLGGYY